VFFYLFTFAISLWHRKFVTADVTVAFVNNQHGIQRRGPHFDFLKHINTLSVHSSAHRGIKIGALKMQLHCIFSYLLNICRKFEFLIFQGNVATCVRWGG